jgi:hypothetical protein
MDSTKSPTASPQRNRRRPLRVAIALAIVILFAIIAAFVTESSSDQTVTWLSPDGVTRSMRPSRLETLKYKLMTLTGRFWRSPGRIQIDCHSKLLLLSPATAGQLNLGAASSTNKSGARAWILTEAGLNSFRQLIKTNTAINTQFAPEIIAADGMRCQSSMGNSVVVNDKPVTIGTIVDLVPKVVSHSVRLTVGVTSTELLPPSADNLPKVKTNVAAACRVSVPNAGGILVDGGTPTNADGKTYWFLISPVLINPDGTRAKF